MISIKVIATCTSSCISHIASAIPARSHSQKKLDSACVSTFGGAQKGSVATLLQTKNGINGISAMRYLSLDRIQDKMWLNNEDEGGDDGLIIDAHTCNHIIDLIFPDLVYRDFNALTILLLSIWAPLSKSILAISVWPFIEAKCRAVNPH